MDTSPFNEPDQSHDNSSPSVTPDPSQPVLPESPPKPSRKKWLLLGLFVLLMVIAIVGYVFFVRQSSDNATPIGNTSNQTTTPELASVFCAAVGIKAVQCEDLNTQELRKYTLPDTLGQIHTLRPNPNGDKYIVSAWQTLGDSSVTKVGILDGKLDQFTEFPFTSDDTPKWLTNSKVVYQDPGTAYMSPFVLKVYDVDTKQSSELVRLSTVVERYMLTKDENIIHGLSSYNVPAENATKRKLVRINLATKEITDLKNLDTPGEDIAYDADTDAFYSNILNGPQQTWDVQVFKVEATADSFSIKETQRIAKKHTVSARAYETHASSKGVLVNDGFIIVRAPLQFVDGTGTITDAKLAVGSMNSMYFSLKAFPDFPKAETNDIVVTDFMQLPADTPQKIASYLEARAMGDTGCNPGEYTTFADIAFDGESQLAVLEYGCNVAARSYYKANDTGGYTLIASTQEGMSCEARDAYGISPKLLVNCRMPGEGL